MKRHTLNIVLCLLSIFIACNSNKNTGDGIENVINIVNNSSDLTKIPTVTNHNNSGFYYDLRNLKRQLNITNLSSSSGTLEFRAWFDLPGLILRQRLFILKYTDGKFSSSLTKFKVDWWTDRKKDPVVIYSEITSGIPKSGWDNFSKRLFTNDFLSIFDIDKNPTGTPGIDGNFYCFELIADKHYWMSAFRDPNDEDQNVKIFRLLTKITMLIEEEFNFSNKSFVE